MGRFEGVADLCQVCALVAHKQGQAEEIFGHKKQRLGHPPPFLIGRFGHL